MKDSLRQARLRSTITCVRLLAVICLGVIAVPLFLKAAPPTWWSTRGVTSPGSVSSDYSAINQGQLKNLAKQAMQEMNARLPGGAGDEVQSLVNSWSTPTVQTNDYKTANLGQLKAVAKPFYSRFIALGYTDRYPWTVSIVPPNDFLLANIGQAKNLFNFDPSLPGAGLDLDHNGLPDWWEIQYFGHAGLNPLAPAPYGGINLLQAYQQGVNPLGPTTAASPMLRIVGGDGQSGAPGTVLGQPLTVSIRDVTSNPLANAVVTFQISANDGGLADNANSTNFVGSLMVNTNANGEAKAYFRLPSSAGVSRLVASCQLAGNTIIPSNPVQFTETAKISGTVPAAPSDLTFSFGANQTILIGWHPNSDDETGFMIQRRLIGTTWIDVGSAAARATTFTDATASAGTPYLYRVVAYNASGQSFSDPIYIGTAPVVIISNPLDGQQTAANGRFFLSATTLDNGAKVSKIEFFEGATQIGSEVDEPPYSTVWEFVPAGAHVITARATYSNGARVNSDPITVSAIKFPFIAAGGSQSFSLQMDGTLWAWGNNDKGQLGIGTSGDKYFAPVKVNGTFGTKKVSAGTNHTLILNADNSVSAFGSNDRKQLGTANGDSQLTPTPIPGLTNVIAVAAGNGTSAALGADGQVWTWGADHATPTLVNGLTNVTAIAAGSTHFLALAVDKTLWAWGENAAGELGNGTTISASNPVHLTGIANVAAIAAGNAYSVALTEQGDVYTWGDNSQGQLGQGNDDSLSTPTLVGNLPKISAITTSEIHTLVLTETGNVWAFGSNDRQQLGDSTNDFEASPIEVSITPQVVQIAAGAHHSMALTIDGQILTWGGNASGQLGSDNTSGASTGSPSAIASLRSGGASNGGQSKPNPGGGGGGPQVDLDHDNDKYPSLPPELIVIPGTQPDPTNGSPVELSTTAHLQWSYKGKETPTTVTIQRRDGAAAWQTLVPPAAGETEFDDEGLFASVSYQYRVLVSYTNGRELYSNTSGYSVPFVTSMSMKSVGYLNHKGDWATKEFTLNGIPAKIPKYYLAESWGLDDEHISLLDGGEKNRTYEASSSNDPTTRTKSGTFNEYTSYDFPWAQGYESKECVSYLQKRSPGNLIASESSTYAVDNFDATQYDTDPFHVSDVYHLNTQLNHNSTYVSNVEKPSWAGDDFDLDAGTLSHVGISNMFENSASVDGPAYAWSQNGHVDANLDGTWIGSFTNSLGVTHTIHSPYDPPFYPFVPNWDLLDFNDNDATSSTTRVKHDVYSDSHNIYDIEYVDLLDVLGQEYTTDAFIKDTVKALPDYPETYTKHTLWSYDHRFETRSPGDYGRLYHVANRTFYSTQEAAYLEKAKYKFSTNPSKPVSLSFYEVFIPTADSAHPNDVPKAKVVSTHTITASTEASTEYKIDTSNVPDRLQDGGTGGKYYITPGVLISAGGNILDSSSDAGADNVSMLDAKEKADGSAILSPPSATGSQGVNGSIALNFDYILDEYGSEQVWIDPSQITYILSWTNATDVDVYGGGRLITSGVEFTQHDSQSGIVYSISAKSGAQDGELIKFTLTRKLNGTDFGSDSVTYKVSVDAPPRSYTIPFDEASGSRYRKVALNGRPMPDEKPQQSAESDQEKEETYVDALTLALHHSVTDIYVPVGGSDLSLAIRRNTISEGWNMRGGYRPHERFDRPFGAGWSTNIGACLEVVEKKGITYNYVTDQNGAIHRFISAGGKMVPLPSDQRENGDYLTSLDGLTFTDRYGTRIYFSGGARIVRSISGDRTAFSANETHFIYRVNSIVDRLGNTLNYQYPPDAATIIPSTIRFGDHLDQTLYIRQDGSGHITETWDPNGNHYRYTYQLSPAYIFGGRTYQETLLQSVIGPDGKMTQYSYELFMEADLTPSDINQDKPTNHFHIDIASIQNPSHNTTTFTYKPDQSKYDFDSRTGLYYHETGSPRNVYTVNLPGIAGVPVFENQSMVRLKFDANGLPTVEGSIRKNRVTDAVGKTINYTFGGGHAFDTTGVFPGTPLWAIPKVVFYTGMTIEYPEIGSEYFTFDPTAGLALSSVTDLCGHTTTYTFADRLQLKLPNGTTEFKYEKVFPYPDFCGFYSDPSTQANALPATKTFAYTSNPWHLLSDVTDEEGRKTHYTFDDASRRKEETISEASGVLVQKTMYTYDETFPGFVRQRTVQKLETSSGPTAWVQDLITQYVADDSGRVAKQIVDPTTLSLTTSYIYDNNGNKTSVTDPQHHITQFVYDERNRLATVVYPDSSQKQFVYDDCGNKIQELDENNHATLFEYDALNRLITKARDMNGDLHIESNVDLVTSYTYDDVNSPVKITDPNGKATTNRYDDLQRLTQVEHPSGPSTFYNYDFIRNCGGTPFDSSSFKPTQIIDPAGYVTDITYDANYRPTLTSRHYELGTSLVSNATTVYDNVGNLLSTTDARGHTTQTCYDALNRPYLVTYPDNTTNRATFSSTGLKWKTEDENLQVTQIHFDGAGRPTDVFAPAVHDSATQQMANPHSQSFFDANGNVIATTDPLGNQSNFTFDSRNRRTDEYGPAVFDEDSGSNARPYGHTDYDSVGNRKSATDTRGGVTTYELDPANRVTKLTNPPVPVNGDPAATVTPITQTTYDFNGNVLSVTDANGHVTTNYYDPLNRLLVTVDPQHEATRYGYDDLGNRTLIAAGLRMTGASNGLPTLVVGSNPQTTTLTYDGLSRNTLTNYPSGPVSFVYDGVVKLKRQDGNGLWTLYDSYDPRNRLLHVSYPSSPQDSRTYSYDGVGRIVGVEEDHAGATDVAYTYDALGRTLTEMSQGVTHTYQYDLAGNRASTQYGGTGRTLLSTYDKANRLQSLVDGSNTTTYGYDLGGHVRRKLLSNGEVETTSYDAAGRQSESSDVNGSGGLLYAYNYGYDAVGNLTLMGDAKAGLPTRCVTMDYTANDRLQTESVHAGASASAPLSRSTTYHYDEMGNRTTRAVTGGATTLYTYNAAGQLQGYGETGVPGVGFGYDGNGNRLTRSEGAAQAVYVFDAENRLVGLDQGGVHYAYLYDYRSRRVSRTEGTLTTQVVYSGGSSVQEYTVSNGANGPPPGLAVELVRGSDWGGGVGGLLYSVRGGAASYAHCDGRGDVVTRTNGSGSVTYQANYEAWGTRTGEFGASADRQRANTKEEDPTGLLDEGYRFRDLAAGCFISRDPAGFVDGPNLYAYVRQNPWTKFDPEGLAADPALGGMDQEMGILGLPFDLYDAGKAAISNGAAMYKQSRSEGKGVTISTLDGAAYSFGKATGIGSIVEGITGVDRLTGAKLSGEERVDRAGTGTIQVGSIIAAKVAASGEAVPEAAPETPPQPQSTVGGKSAQTTSVESGQTVAQSQSPALPARPPNPVTAEPGAMQTVDPKLLTSGQQAALSEARLGVQKQLIQDGVKRNTPIRVQQNGVIFDGHHGAAAAANAGKTVEVQVVPGEGTSRTNLPPHSLPTY